MPKPVMNKVPEYPRPHEYGNSWGMSVESTAARASTIYPLITSDEGLGAISAYESCPANSAFTEAPSDHCYPTSRINKIHARLMVSMSKVMLETDKVHAVTYCTALIHTAFDEGAQALDDLSTLDLNEILELQSETTDRQTYGLYNTVDLADYKANTKLDLPAETLGLDTDLEIEATAFKLDDYYDCLKYYTNGGKLAKICTPLKWHTITRNHPVNTHFFQQQENTKYMNPYTFLGVLIHVPGNSKSEQLTQAGDTTIDTCNLQFSMTYNYNEWNHEFNHSIQ